MDRGHLARIGPAGSDESCPHVVPVGLVVPHRLDDALGADADDQGAGACKESRASPVVGQGPVVSTSRSPRLAVIGSV